MSSAPNYLTTQLRESAPYLKDAGWHQTATLVTAAADEIEALRALVEELTLRAPVAEANENKHQEWPVSVRRLRR
ncbi:MAG: hypothetical protein QOJ04_7011 [Caballeronia sp.]|jgi:hypothetical protein|nr:hypothetical protein [Caballeronia sp.]